MSKNTLMSRRHRWILGLHSFGAWPVGVLFSRRNLLIFLLSVSMLVAGGAIEKNRRLLYRQFTGLVGLTRSGVSAEYAALILASQYSRDTQELPLQRGVDSALLPLRIKGVRLSEHFPTAKAGGAIAAVGRAVIVLDRLGNMYGYRPGQGVEKLAFPSLPNNIADYVAQPDARIDERIFRAHQIKYSSTLKLIAVSHEFFDTSTHRTRLAVSVIGVDEASLRATGSWQTIYLSDPEPGGANEADGGALAFAVAGKIYLTIGDNFVPRLAQDPVSSFGKIVEIDIATHHVRQLTLGHRNPQGLAATKDGRLFSTEQGPAGGDELNEVVEGSNYGWPKVTLGTDYGSYSSPGALVGRHEGYKKPLFAWVPSVAPANLLEVAGFDPRWDGDLLVGSLKAQTLFRLRLDGLRVLYAEPIYIGQRIRDLAQMPDGTIALWTDDSQLLFISVDRPKLAGSVRSSAIHDTLRSECMYCHHFGPTNPTDFAPSLSNLINRKIASDNFRYTAALREKDGVWTEENLRKFLADPRKFASGTTMPPRNLSPDAIDEVIQDLTRAQSSSE